MIRLMGKSSVPFPAKYRISIILLSEFDYSFFFGEGQRQAGLTTNSSQHFSPLGPCFINESIKQLITVVLLKKKFWSFQLNTRQKLVTVTSEKGVKVEPGVNGQLKDPPHSNRGYDLPLPCMATSIKTTPFTEEAHRCGSKPQKMSVNGIYLSN